MKTKTTTYVFFLDGVKFKLYQSLTGKFKVKCIDDDETGNWDYEDEDHARDMSSEISCCKTLDEALDILELV